MSIWIWDDQGSEINHYGLLVYNAMYLWLWNAYDIGTRVSRSVKNLSYRKKGSFAKSIHGQHVCQRSWKVVCSPAELND
jgi:hypothetical protein